MKKPFSLTAVLIVASVSFTSCVGGETPPRSIGFGIRISASSCIDPTMIIKTDKNYLDPFAIRPQHTKSGYEGKNLPYGEAYRFDLFAYKADANESFKDGNYDYIFDSGVFHKDNPDIFSETPTSVLINITLRCAGKQALVLDVNAVSFPYLTISDDATASSGLKITTTNHPPENFL